MEAFNVPSLHHHSLDPRAAIVMNLVPRASAHQADEARLSKNFIPGQSYESLNIRARHIRLLKNLNFYAPSTDVFR